MADVSHILDCDLYMGAGRAAFPRGTTVALPAAVAEHLTGFGLAKPAAVPAAPAELVHEAAAVAEPPVE